MSEDMKMTPGPTEADLLWLKSAAGLPNMPTPLTYWFRMAISGEGPHAHDWSDKPHRLVYDLCRHIEAEASALPDLIEALKQADSLIDGGAWPLVKAQIDAALSKATGEPQ